MINILQTQHGCNTRPLNDNGPLLSKACSIRVFIASSFEHGTAYFAAVIYASTSVLYRFDGWLDDSTAERAWLHALSLAYEWRDYNAPNARLLILPAIETKNRGAA